MHYMLALIFLAIPMIVHMWIIFVPVIAGVPFRLYHVGETPPAVKLNPFVDGNGTIFMLPEDFLRLPLAILVFMILLPLSVANYTRLRSWTISHWLHIFGAAIYVMDFLRGNHPHAQV
jgi:hypothetical protein